jgi:hypothetical protein
MKNISLEINGVPVDFLDARSIPIKIFKSISDANNPGSKSGDFTLTIRLPRTPANELFFQGLYEIETIDKFRRGENLQARLLVNTSETISGRFIVTRITKDNFEGIIYAENVLVFKDFGDKTLQDIQSFQPYTFLGESTMRSVWAMDWRESPLQFPLIAYGPWFNQFYDSADADGFGTFFDPNRKASISPQSVGINWEDVKPAAYVAAITRAMFIDIGWKCGGFFQNEGDKLLLAYTGKTNPKWNWGTVGILSAQQSGTGQSFDDLSNSPGDENYWDFYEADNDQPATIPFLGIWQMPQDSINTDPALLFDLATAEYVVPEDGNYTFRIKISDLDQTRLWDDPFETTPGTAYNARNSMLAVLRIPDNDFDKESLYANLKEHLINLPSTALFDPNICCAYNLNSTASNRGPFTIDDAGNNLGGTINSDTITTSFSVPAVGQTQLDVVNGACDITSEPKALRRGDIVKLVFIQPPTIENGNFKKIRFVHSSCTSSSIEITNDIRTQIDVAENLPSLKQMDLVEDLITMFNLFWFIKLPERKIYFLTEDQYFRDNEFALDFTDKASLESGEQTPIDQFTQLSFNWGSSQDWYYREAQKAQDNYTRINASAFANGTKEVGPQNLKPSMDRLFLNFSEGVTVANAKPMYMPILADESAAKQKRSESNWRYDYEPRILVWAGLQPSPLWEFHNNPVLETLYPMAYFNRERVGLSTGLSLGFPAEAGLFKRYWFETIEEAERSYILEVLAMLNENDIAEIDPSKPIRISQQFYKLNKLDGYNPVSELPTKIELIKRLRN